MIRKNITQATLYLIEVCFAVFLLYRLSIKVFPLEDYSWSLFERLFDLYVVYQFLVYLVLKLRQDSIIDEYTELIYVAKGYLLAIENNDPKAIQSFNVIVSKMHQSTMMNDKKVLSYYDGLIQNVNNKNVYAIRHDINLFEHIIELERLEWRYSFLLRIFK